MQYGGQHKYAENKQSKEGRWATDTIFDHLADEAD